MHDKQGREYAKLSQLKVGSHIVLDDDFNCAHGRKVIHADAGGYYFACEDGQHYLAGQVASADDDSLIGIYLP